MIVSGPLQTTEIETRGTWGRKEFVARLLGACRVGGRLAAGGSVEAGTCGPRSGQSLSWNRNCLAWCCRSEMRDLQPFTCLFKSYVSRLSAWLSVGHVPTGCTGDGAGRSDPLGADVVCGLH